MKLTLRRRHSQTGNLLIVTVLVMAVVGVFVDLALRYTSSINRNVQRSLLLRQATNIGDSSTEMAFSSWRAICRASQTSILQRDKFDNEIPTPTPGNFPGVATYQLSNYAIYPLNSSWTPLTGGASKPTAIAGPNHGDLSYYYLATADVVIPTVNSRTAANLTVAAALTDPGNLVAKVRRVFQKETISLWRYAVFFDDDLEMHPGAAMNINGDVHTNGRLFTGHNLLTLSGKTTYVGDWRPGFKNVASFDPAWAAGDPRRQQYETTHDAETPASPNWATGLPPASDQTQQPYGVALADYHQLIEYTTTPTTLDPYRFQGQAGVVITIDAANNVKIYNSGGADITNATTGNNGRIATAFRNAIATNETITDNREGATTGNASIRVATLDVNVIQQAMDSGDSNVKFNLAKTVSGQTVNNLVYIVDTSAGATGTTNKRGIRLKNGSKIPNGGLTIASGSPVYIQGDFNTGSSLQSVPGTPPSVQPPSNVTGDSTQPTVSGYTRQPAAVIGDAVNILSNSWLDSQSGTNPAASPTTVNAAIISGNVPTGNGYYSGGVENFPRFLENWGGKQFTYYGSMIQLYQSQQAIGRWGASNVYSPPQRAWYFDTNFVTSPPPGVLVSYNYRRSRWYTQ